MRPRVITIALAVTLAACATPAPKGAHRRGADRGLARARHRHRPPLLRMFLQRMPKGGDIHSHLTGAVYAESYIAWAAAAEPACARTRRRGTITSCCPPAATTRPVADALRDPAFYNALVDGLSTRNLANRSTVRPRSVLRAFRRFSSATDGRCADMLAELAEPRGRPARHVPGDDAHLPRDEVRELGEARAPRRTIVVGAGSDCSMPGCGTSSGARSAISTTLERRRLRHARLCPGRASAGRAASPGAISSRPQGPRPAGRVRAARLRVRARAGRAPRRGHQSGRAGGQSGRAA